MMGIKKTLLKVTYQVIMASKLPKFAELTAVYDYWISLLHFDIAVDDLASKPMIRFSMGTKIPPPPTPPTLPNAAPKNPIMVPTTIFQPNFIS